MAVLRGFWRDTRSRIKTMHLKLYLNIRGKLEETKEFYYLTQEKIQRGD